MIMSGAAAAMRIAMICSLVLSSAAAVYTSVRHPAAAAAPASEYKTYTILLKPRHQDDGVVMDAAASREWYSSYLPDESTVHDDKPRILLTYDYLFDGFVARLTDDELHCCRPCLGSPDSAAPSRRESCTRPPPARRTPGFLGLAKGSGLWESSSYGRGVIIGVIDSGIDCGHPSFHDAGVSPTPAKWKGSCTGDGARCNNKLIGTKTFVGSFFAGYYPIIDENSHGTNCASAAAGNFVANASAGNGQAAGTASGIAHKVCATKQEDGWRGLRRRMRHQAEGDEPDPDPDEDDAVARAEAEWDAAAEVVERWESPAAEDALVFDSREDAEEYLAAAACLAGAPGPRADAALQAAMARLEDEFRHLLVRGAPPLAAEDLQASLLRRRKEGKRGAKWSF